MMMLVDEKIMKSTLSIQRHLEKYRDKEKRETMPKASKME